MADRSPRCPFCFVGQGRKGAKEQKGQDDRAKSGYSFFLRSFPGSGPLYPLPEIPSSFNHKSDAGLTVSTLQHLSQLLLTFAPLRPWPTKQNGATGRSLLCVRFYFCLSGEAAESDVFHSLQIGVAFAGSES